MLIKKYSLIYCLVILFIPFSEVTSQGVMSPELLWSLGRVNGAFVTSDQKSILYTVSSYDFESNKKSNFLFSMDESGKNIKRINASGTNGSNPISWGEGNYIYTQNNECLTAQGNKLSIPNDANILKFGPKNGQVVWSQLVKTEKTTVDYYPEYSQSTARIYDDLLYRHWDQWSDGTHNHLFVGSMAADGQLSGKDIMAGTSYDSPTMPFGGAEDVSWSPDGNTLAYASVKKTGKQYALSTNSDIYLYDVNSGNTNNISKGMMGYDKSPSFSPKGTYLAWTSMPRDGYEADKNSLWVVNLTTGVKANLFEDWDGTVDTYIWSNDDEIFFTAPWKGTVQLFSALLTKGKDGLIHATIIQITKDIADYTQIIGITANGNIIASRTDMNHAAELYSVHPRSGVANQITHVNDQIYNSIALSKVEGKFMKSKDGKDLFSWVIFPPDFDPNKKYPMLLYCQGGPQSALSQFYSFRWNFQLMAANGYIVVAPNRRGMPGWGQAWNEAISRDWGGGAIQDYLAATDEMMKMPYVDSKRVGAVGASYGGYSVYMLAGIHENRFKTFISHCGLFNMESWYGSTEELWFANFDLGGPYWEVGNDKSYKQYNPINFVNKWNTPILIFEGEKDFRVPYTQGLEAYQAAQLKGIKSRLVIFPDENHWVTKPQNSLVWHNEFYRWLRETL